MGCNKAVLEVYVGVQVGLGFRVEGLRVVLTLYPKKKALARNRLVTSSFLSTKEHLCCCHY